jgi:non-heme chloroperoxidase
MEMKGRSVITTLGVIVIATTVAVQARERSAADSVSTEALEPRFTRVRLATGVELQVVESGPATGRPVLFLHGYTDSWFSFSRILGGLPRDVRAIVPSQRGHGDSERPACCYTVDDFARDAVALLDALGVRQADVVGHSMGSIIAQRIAAEHPARVGRLVLIGATPTGATPVVEEFNVAVRALVDPIPDAFAREFQVSAAYDSLPSQFLDRVVRESMKVPAHVWRAALSGIIAPEARSDLARIEAPTVILWGEQDAFFPRAQQDILLAGIPHAHLVTFDRIGHSPHWEDPERFLQKLNEFLEEEAVSVSGGQVPQ